MRAWVACREACRKAGHEACRGDVASAAVASLLWDSRYQALFSIIKGRILRETFDNALILGLTEVCTRNTEPRGDFRLY